MQLKFIKIFYEILESNYTNNYSFDKDKDDINDYNKLFITEMKQKKLLPIKELFLEISKEYNEKKYNAAKTDTRSPFEKKEHREKSLSIQKELSRISR